MVVPGDSPFFHRREMLIFWLALRREWGNEAKHGYSAEKFIPSSPSWGPAVDGNSDYWITWTTNEFLRVYMKTYLYLNPYPKHAIPPRGQARLLDWTPKSYRRCLFQSFFSLTPKFVENRFAVFDDRFCFRYGFNMFKFNHHVVIWFTIILFPYWTQS